MIFIIILSKEKVLNFMKKFTELTEISLTKTAITFLTYKFLLLLRKPFIKWEAYEAGLIDKKGDLLKKPKTTEEKKALDKLTNLVRKIKKLLGKYIPNEKLLTFLVTIYLLKETPENLEYNNLSTKLRSYLSDDENNLICDILVEHNS